MYYCCAMQLLLMCGCLFIYADNLGNETVTCNFLFAAHGSHLKSLEGVRWVSGCSTLKAQRELIFSMDKRVVFALCFLKNRCVLWRMSMRHAVLFRVETKWLTRGNIIVICDLC